MTAAEEGAPWFAPTDPVVAATGDARGLAVLNGFAPTSDDQEAGRSGTVIPDRLIEERVARALADDAATSDLEIIVSARGGVVHLRGTTPTLEDAENAEAVASGVAGVRRVRESLRIGTFREQP
ncbi:MAG: BON domain-containing protein [Chloroflexota bacterium]